MGKGVKGPSGRVKAALADLHQPKHRDATPRTRKWIEDGADVLLSPQPRSNKTVIDDVCGNGLPRVKRGAQIQYVSSIFSPDSPAHVLSRGKGEEGAGTQVRERGGPDDSREEDSAPKRHKRVLASYHAMKKVVDKLDTARTGSITGRDLENAMGKLGIQMRRSDFSRLAGEIDPDSHSQYRALDTKPHGLNPLEEGSSRRRKGDIASLPKIGRKGGQHEATQQHSKLSWRSLLEKKVCRNWKQLQRAFKLLDTQRSRLIDMHVLIPTLEAHNIFLQTHEVDALYLQLGVGRSGKVDYVEFLKSFAGAALARTGANSAPPDLVLSKNRLNPLPSDVETYLRSSAVHWRAIRWLLPMLLAFLTHNTISVKPHQFTGNPDTQEL